MVHSPLRRSKTTVAKKTSVVYRSGATCLVLSPEDNMSLVQFFSLLMKIDHRLQQKSKDRNDNPQKIKLSKTKGSHLSGPFILQRQRVITPLININIKTHQLFHRSAGVLPFQL